MLVICLFMFLKNVTNTAYTSDTAEKNDNYDDNDNNNNNNNNQDLSNIPFLRNVSGVFVNVPEECC